MDYANWMYGYYFRLHSYKFETNFINNGSVASILYQFKLVLVVFNKKQKYQIQGYNVLNLAIFLRT